ncbi:MAG: L,D-transpeptidase family protein [Beijerinckiaceae bacterium]
MMLHGFHASPAGASEEPTVLSCNTIQDSGLLRQVCEHRPVSEVLKLELPAPPPAVETGGLSGFAPQVPLPEGPPDVIVIAPETAIPDKLETASIVPPSLPDVRLPEPELPPLAVITPEKTAPQKEAIAAIPSDILKKAIAQLKPQGRLSEKERDGLERFYEARQFSPVWISNGAWTEQAKAIRARLALAAEDGLDPARYRSVSAFVAAGEPQWAALAAAELQLSEAVLRYARDASTGQILPSRVHAFIIPRLVFPLSEDVLAKVHSAANAGEALHAYNPPHPGYAALRRKLAELRVDRSVPVGEHIPDGPALRLGMRDPRVPLIRARLGLGYEAGPIYDRSVSIRVAGLQKTAGLPVTGAFTSQTRRALIGELPSADEAEIIANMERWRWLPRELGTDHIFVNVPALALEMKKADKVVHTARIIIGKDDTQTPVFSDMMDHIVVNPSWFVPPSVLKKDPRYLDPAWTEARGYTLRKRGDVVTVRVPPGASNALGNVKFMFPNEHAVYLHDTPTRHLFNARNRMLSNGCVRVEHPFKLAAAIFENEGWTEERFKKQIGGDERMMKLAKKLPIHIAYFTMTVDSGGELVRHTDFYGHSSRLRQLLGLL